MAKYHCPQCQKELVRGPYAAWVKWCIGPLFGHMLKPLICDEHGEVKIESLSPDEQASASRTRFIGLFVGGLVNIIILIVIVWLAFNSG